jgi:hypothetical protein
MTRVTRPFRSRWLFALLFSQFFFYFIFLRHFLLSIDFLSWWSKFWQGGTCVYTTDPSESTPTHAGERNQIEFFSKRINCTSRRDIREENTRSLGGNRCQVKEWQAECNSQEKTNPSTHPPADPPVNKKSGKKSNENKQETGYIYVKQRLAE